ncbi:hypothetical protein MRX96_037055 [Rhipicephalus microplus]
MVVNNLLLALACCALGSPQVAHLTLHKTKRPPTLPEPATTPASAVVTTESPSVNATIAEDYLLTREPQIGTLDGRWPEVFSCVHFRTEDAQGQWKELKRTSERPLEGHRRDILASIWLRSERLGLVKFSQRHGWKRIGLGLGFQWQR